MNDLQIILIIIGGLIIAGVIVFNWWQERKFRRHLESSFSTLHDDALLDDPKLDVAKLNIAHDDIGDQFSFEPSKSLRDIEPIDQPVEVDFSSSVEQVNTQESYNSLPAVDDDLEEPSNLLHKELAGFSDEGLTLGNDVKTTLKHEGIKTIFSDAFNRSVKAAIEKTEAQEELESVEVPKVTVETQAGSIEADQDSVLTLPEMLHPQIDLTSVLYLSKETPLKTLHDSFIGFVEAYDKAVFIHVLLPNNQWSLLNEVISNPHFANQEISKLTCSIQLADRAGAVSRTTLNRFQMAVETLGLDINAHVEWQGTGDTLSAAKELDAFCIDVDKTIGFHLVHGESGAFTGTKLRGLAEAQGLTMSDGTFKYFDKDESSHSLVPEPSFIMFNREPYPFSAEMLRGSVIKSVTFQLDIPRVKHCAEAYNQMVQVAKQMEVGLNSSLVADNNKELGDIQIEKIRQQLKVIHATMLTRGIIPGSDSALRLFS